jgi:cytochrome c peroxidase
VDPTDSVLGPIAMPNKGLSVSYSTLIQAAFRPEYWSSSVGVLKSGQLQKQEASVTMDLVPRPNGQTLVDDTFTQMEANFSLFFGLSVQVYESSLIANQTPFDKFMEGKLSAQEFGPDAVAGLALFTGKGKCDACHGGPELTNASVANVANERLERMIMGNDGIAVYDNGFYNTAVRRTKEDPGVGGKDPFGNPLSETAFCEANGVQNCPIKNQNANGQLQNTSIATTIAPRPGEPVPPSPLLAPQCPPGARTSVFNPATGTYTCDRINVMGAFKTPGLRNVELTGPYMHNGGMATLRQVVDFYNRGGDFPGVNQDNLDPNIVPLGLTNAEANQLVAFMLKLTDERVRAEKAPFDHPQLFVPNGHPGNTTSVTQDPNNPGQATDTNPLLEIPAVGANGGAAVQSFTQKLGIPLQTQP